VQDESCYLTVWLGSEMAQNNSGSGMRYAVKALIGVAAAVVLGNQLRYAMDEEHEFVGGVLHDSVQSRKDRKDTANWFDSHYFINKDNLAIYYHSWLPTPVAQPSVKAIVVLSHGLGEHVLRYEKLGRKLAEKGFALYALDHQGHGHSEGTRHYVKHFVDFCHDVHQLTEIAKSKHPSVKKVFLLGHSMGSLIAIHSVNEAPRLYDGVVLVAPPLKIEVPEIAKTVVPVIASYLPKLPAPGLDITTLCRDAGVVDRYLSDPLVGQGTIKLRLLSELAKASLDVPNFSPNFPIPYLLLHGTADKLCLIEGSQAFHDSTKVEDKTFITYPDAFHELLNEPGHEDEAMSEVINWLEKRV